MGPGSDVILPASRKIKGVTMANSILGRFDAIAVIEANNSEELTKIIYEMIEAHPNVVHTETLLSMFTP